jgi:hypothetical protein
MVVMLGVYVVVIVAGIVPPTFRAPPLVLETGSSG